MLCNRCWPKFICGVIGVARGYHGLVDVGSLSEVLGCIMGVLIGEYPMQGRLQKFVTRWSIFLTEKFVWNKGSKL